MTAISERVEDPDLDLWVCGQSQELFIAGHGFAVVGDNPDVDASIRRAQQRLLDEPPRIVTAEDVVLEVKTLLSLINQFEPQEQSVNSC